MLGQCCPLLVTDDGETQTQVECSVFPFVVVVEAVLLLLSSEGVVLLFSTNAIT